MNPIQPYFGDFIQDGLQEEELTTIVGGIEQIGNPLIDSDKVIGDLEDE